MCVCVCVYSIGSEGCVYSIGSEGCVCVCTVEGVTWQLMAVRRNVRTTGETGAAPVIISRTRPPSPLWRQKHTHTRMNIHWKMDTSFFTLKSCGVIYWMGLRFYSALNFHRERNVNSHDNIQRDKIRFY